MSDPTKIKDSRSINNTLIPIKKNASRLDLSKTTVL
jgi:hypothetical protein